MPDYQRFQVPRPEYLGDAHWRSIEAEVTRLDRSLSAGDLGQAIGDLKCLVEAVAKVALDIAGTPADPSAAFDKTVNGAHNLLVKQPGHEIANTSDFGRMATQASRIARGLGGIRNDFGGGHGRARQPVVQAEMTDMALDGGLMWVRWALRRLGLFSEGRPAALIRDLVEESATFRAGMLSRRLHAADMASLEPAHQRALGVAVGQRAMQGTFVVFNDGVAACLDSDDTATMWTADYRIGLAQGLLFDAQERPTVTDESLRNSLTAFDPLPQRPEELDALVDRVVTSTTAGRIARDAAGSFELAAFVRSRIQVRPLDEHRALERLILHVNPF
ncbi:MAG TPA: hypothetical protein VIM10_04225 [Actinopolymorphaceae bacterium]